MSVPGIWSGPMGQRREQRFGGRGCRGGAALDRMARSGRPDLNRGPRPPKGRALPGCATPRRQASLAPPGDCRIRSAAMAEVRPLNALHYDLAAVGSLGDVVAPPYDVIDAEQRRELVARSAFNAVELDLPEAAEGADPYLHAAETLEAWTLQGILAADREPALWALAQEYTGPDGERRTRRGFLGRVRVTEYGPGLIRPHERTQPGPKEDRLRLTRATRHNLSPIFSL